jgi:hypothetical protein
MPLAQNPSFVTIGCQKTVLLHNIQYYCSNVQPSNQAPMPSNDSALLDKASKKHIQQNVGSFLFYARAVEPTIVMALSDLSSQHQH